MTDAAHGGGGGGAGGGGGEAVGAAPLSGEVLAMQQTGAALGSAHQRLPASSGADMADVASPGGGAGLGSLQPFHSSGLQDISQASATAGGLGGASSSVMQHLLGTSSLSGPVASPFGSQAQPTVAGLQQLAQGTSAQQQPSHAQQQQQTQQQQSLAVAPNVLAMLAALTASQPAAAGANQGGAGGAAAGGAAGGLQLPRPAPLGLTALATLAAKQQAVGNAAGGGVTAPGGAGGAARAGSGGGASGNGGGAAGNGSGGAAGAAAAAQLNPINFQAALQAAAASALMVAQRNAVAAAVQHAQSGLDGHAVGTTGGGGDARKRKRSSPSPPAAGTSAAVARMVAGGTHHLGSGGAILGGLGDGAEGDRDSPCRNQTGYVGVRMRKWGMFAAEIRDGDKRRWLGSFGTAHEAGLAYDAAAIVQKGTKAKTNFSYMDYETNPRPGAETIPHVRWDLLPEEVAQQMAARAVPNKGGRLGIGAPAASRPRGSSKGPPPPQSTAWPTVTTRLYRQQRRQQRRLWPTIPLQPLAPPGKARRGRGPGMLGRQWRDQTPPSQPSDHRCPVASKVARRCRVPVGLAALGEEPRWVLQRRRRRRRPKARQGDRRCRLVAPSAPRRLARCSP
ncbi:hypothetical protein Vafri_6612 [Volvox africanus]|uniref:AP2/ERF domain-containing protein n=1 Tax=Volvox africanus TaxID=51714 RepID=A0A8J4EWW6_9CHLO|nr:hypothetical protein Vafri_6612 [Volvox africanus]